MKTQVKNNGGSRFKQAVEQVMDPVGLSVTIPKFELATCHLKVKSLTPLICHAWSEKAIREMLDRQMGKAKGPRPKKNPLEDFKGSLYYLPEKKGLGMPAPAFKACIVSGANDVQMKMTEIKRCVHVDFYTVPVIAPPLPKEHWSEWDHEHEKELEWWHNLGCGMRLDLVRLETGVADLRFRGWFPTWECELRVAYSKSLTLEQVVNLFQSGGQGCGIGEWRPSAPVCRSGEYGRFQVV